MRIVQKMGWRGLIPVLLVLILCFGCRSGEPVQTDYTVPSWTLYQRALLAGQTAEEARKVLVDKDFPYNINATLNGDPTSRMGVAWFTNAGVEGGTVQLVEGRTDENGFTEAIEIVAQSTPVDTVNYISARERKNELPALTGFAAGEKRSYTSHKALLDGLKPGTTYSYRVGQKGAWSPVGTFTTAAAGEDPFEFIYITDTQANTDEMFGTSAATVAAALRETPAARFVLVAGDLIESSGRGSAEWEWEQWFERMQSSWLSLPLVPLQGNHDPSPFHNWSNHFNTDNSFNAAQSSPESQTEMPGTVYSFVWGDALFLIVNYEDHRKGETYFAALEAWMRAQVAAHPEAKWRVAALHKAMFTGADHQTDADGRLVRERFAPVFQDLHIDLALQGHDHVYEAIGPIHTDGTNFTRLAEAVSGQTLSEPTFANGDTLSYNTTGIAGGTFDTTDGTLYLLNNSAGKKKYYPSSEEQMEANFAEHGVADYFGLFNRLGQTGEPTFSRVRVATDTLSIDTYTVADDGTSTLFDAIRIVK